MRFSRDRRGQSVVVGTVVLFGFLIVAMAVYQAQVVPTENANVEFEHSQEVENDIGDLRNAILRAGSTGSAQPARVRLGTRYPQRTFFVNPAPATGNLETQSTDEIQINGVEIGAGAHDNTRDFWETEQPTYETSSIRYTPNYNEYREGPTLTYEHSFVAAEFPNDATLLRTNQTIVRGDRISLTALSGDVSENGVEARSVDPEAVSQGTRTIPINVTEDSEIVLPTAFDNETKLANRMTERYPKINATAERGSGEIRIQFEEDGEFRLRLSEVSVDGEGETDAAYIVPVGPQNVVTDQGVTAEVRDEYNNPVEDATVFIDDEEFVTGDEGRVFTTFETTGSFEATINDSGDPLNYETVDFTVSEAGGDDVWGPNVYDENVDPSQVEVGESFELSATVDSVGPVEDTIYRSGTPIQRVRVERDGMTEPILDEEYDPDDSNETARNKSFSETVSTAGWSDGEYDLTIRGQDASGRWTNDSEVGEAQVTVTDPSEPGPSAGSISGTVTDAETDDGIGGVTITVYDGDSTDAADEVASTTTAGDGTYTVEVDPGEYTVEADADGYNAATEFPVNVGDGEDVENVDFELEPDTPSAFYPDTVTEDVGTITNFENMQDDDDQVAEMRGGQGNAPFDITTTTEQVPAGDYTLEIDVVDGTFQAGGIDVIVTDENGEIGSGTISENGLFTLDLDASVEGDLTVEYVGRNQNNELDINYQRFVTS